MDRTQIEIVELEPNSSELETSAAWRHEAFLKEDGYSLSDSRAQLTKIMNQPEGCEVALIALIGGQIAGICLLVQHELPPAHDLSPWLASLYVAPEFRRRGLGSRLIMAIEDHARRNGVARLHLYTVDMEELYVKCGWRIAERDAVGSGPLALLIRDL
jgi:GNAT superfamily N-acetyltransferase